MTGTNANRTLQSETQSPAATPVACLTVYHDGSCPLCQREIALMKSITPSDQVTFTDVSTLGAHDRVTADLTVNDAMRRFHVRRADGQLVSGAAAFITMWSASPKLRWLAAIGKSPRAVRLLDYLYSGFLRTRPPLSKTLRRYDAWRAARATR